MPSAYHPAGRELVLDDPLRQALAALRATRGASDTEKQNQAVARAAIRAVADTVLEARQSTARTEGWSTQQRLAIGGGAVAGVPVRFGGLQEQVPPGQAGGEGVEGTEADQALGEREGRAVCGAAGTGASR
ncbi:hypothetical protein GCM10010260_58410 [Streptomyces filipinensis]|uniref:Uncharacterized protein n=1 Tax=Streptomyces filipinensis TaxID=66887 RepID=A0A918IFQ5_9ACTN|nr:hypothetical protein [Streptomyces filipinensis]GGV12111.1 hypothetical protein GCM10010260_58410 [Streptomyces filipinensis]